MLLSLFSLFTVVSLWGLSGAGGLVLRLSPPSPRGSSGRGPPVWEECGLVPDGVKRLLWELDYVWTLRHCVLTTTLSVYHRPPIEPVQRGLYNFHNKKPTSLGFYENNVVSVEISH